MRYATPLNPHVLGALPLYQPAHRVLGHPDALAEAIRWQVSP